MPLQIEPTSPGEQDALIQFLISVFHARLDTPFLGAKLMHWKYFAPRADWNEPRSFVLKQGGQIAAHAGIFPITFLVSTREIRCIHMIDWAATGTVPGAGVLLQRKLAPLTDTFLTVGGSAQTREILPKLGFKQLSNLQLYARVIRPFAQARARKSEGWKGPLRLARNIVWTLAPLPAVPTGWFAARVTQFDDSPLAPLRTRTTVESTVCQHSPATLNYMLCCPGARFSAFLLSKEKEPCGYFMLSWVNRQCRIADVSLNSTAFCDWQAAFALATRTAADDPETCEIQAASSLPFMSDAILPNGFRLRDSLPVFLSDPHDLLSGGPPLYLSLLDGEASYLSDPDYPFLT